jgi:hypothetical protein
MKFKLQNGRAPGAITGEPMRKDRAPILSLFYRSVGLLFATVFVLLAFAPAALAQTSAGPSQPPTTGPSQLPNAGRTPTLREDWRQSMAHAPLPTKGCFTSSYPSTQWKEVPCTKAPARPYPPARGPMPDVVGNGNDASAQVTGTMSEAVGSFDSVTGVTSETGQVDGSGGQVANTFSLQLNSNFFSGTPACNGAANPSNCQGWEQFVYSNSPGSAFIQYWLINYNTICPAGWIKFGSDCFINGSNSVSVPSQDITNLINISLTGEANTGGQDKIIMSVDGTLYAAQNPANALNLSQYWQQAEFNVFGDCCSSEANFNSGSTIDVRTSVNNGNLSAPSCSSGGFTGETNNLNFASAPAANRETLPAIVFTESTAGGAAPACKSATGVGDASSLADSHDFNGDGKSDILWRDTAGGVGVWFMNGPTISATAGLGNVSNAWTVVGQRDFNGDGYADILWTDTVGDVTIWLMNGSTVTSQAVVASGVPATWTIVGTGIFNGNGKSDILWRDAAGDLGIWFMNGTTISATAGLGNMPTNWTVVGTGDFNGDGNTDILWRDTSGNVAIWLMNGSTVLSSAVVANASTNWTVVGTGDFNGDGKSDILWRDTAGDVGIWFMNGTTISATAGLGNVPNTWSVAETGDFNGDGMSDILWRDIAGDAGIWFMNGSTITATASLGNVPNVWAVQSANAD